MQSDRELPPLPLGTLMGSATINGQRVELRMHDDEAVRSYALAAVRPVEYELDRAKAEIRGLLCREMNRMMDVKRLFDGEEPLFDGPVIEQVREHLKAPAAPQGDEPGGQTP